MTTTVKIYIEQSEYKTFLNNKINKCEDLVRCSENTIDTDKEMENAIIQKEDLDVNYFDKVSTVSVQFYIGNRKYYDTVHCIGKTFLRRGKRMNMTNGGYSNIMVINEITEEAKEEMLSDSHYY